MTTRYINPVTQYFDDAGDPLINGKLYYFETGSATPKDTYADIDLQIPNSNPVILDAAGRTPNIFLNGIYKTKLTTSDSTQEWERDSVGEVSDVQFSSWDSTKTYAAADIVQGSNLDYYRSLTAANIANDPTTSPAAWELVLVVGEDTAGRGSDYVPYTGHSKTVTAGIEANAQNITDIKDGTDTLTAPDITSFENALHDHEDAVGGGAITRGLQSVQVFTVGVVTVWDSGTTYAEDDQVTDINGDYYRSLVDSNLNNDPSASPTEWELFTNVTDTWTKPAGINNVIVEVVGGGGAGATGAVSSGGGGGGGGASIKLIDVSAIASETVTVGAATATSSFGAHCSATGGSSGGGADAALGGDGGVGSDGDINLGGADGDNAEINGNIGATGGTAAGWFGGGGGRGVNDAVGAAGNNYGGGGGGGDDTGTTAGGAGAGGIVVVWEYE